MIVSGALALAACSSTPDWMNLDALKPAPMMDTVRFESEPPGAEAKTSNGQTCRTPCALALPVNSPLTVTFTLNGYQPETESIEPIANRQPHAIAAQSGARGTHAGAAAVRSRSKKPARPRRSPPPNRPRAQGRRQPLPARAAPAPMTAAPPQQAPAPWPSTPPPQR